MKQDSTSQPRQLDAWLAARAEHWRGAAQHLDALQDNKPMDVENVRAAILDYPEAARDVAVARRVAPNSRMTAFLESVYSGLHIALYREPKTARASLRRFFGEEVPEVVAALSWHIFSVIAGFILATLAGWWLVQTFPELVSLFASEAMINTVQSGELWTDGLLNILPSSVLSIQIFTNNILVALTAMSLGVLYGLGTIYIIGLNGLMLGGVFAFTHRYELADNLLLFVMAHGPVELTIICIAGAVGFCIGESIARPGQLRRIESFQKAVQKGAKLMLLCVIFLVGAGLIEGYISPDPQFSMTFRIVVGFAYLMVFVFALRGFGLRKRAERS